MKGYPSNKDAQIKTLTSLIKFSEYVHEENIKFHKFLGTAQRGVPLKRGRQKSNFLIV